MALSRGPGDEPAEEKKEPEALQLAAYLDPNPVNFLELLKPREAVAQAQPDHEQRDYIPETDYYARYLRDTPSDDAKFEPELQELLTKLYDRQRREAVDLIDDAHNRLNPDGEQPKVLKTYNEEFREQYGRFAEERERYISDYQKAQTIRDEMQQQSREQALEQGLDDKPKLSY